MYDDDITKGDTKQFEFCFFKKFQKYLLKPEIDID